MDILPYELIAFSRVIAYVPLSFWNSLQKRQVKNYAYVIASRNCVKLLSWAHENGCPLDRSVCEIAAKKGYISILEYAYKNKCPWDNRTCRQAAQHGRLDILMWLKDKGCPSVDELICGWTFGCVEVGS